MSAPTISPAAAAAAQWWAQAVCNPRFDNGSGDIAGLLAVMVSEQHPVGASEAQRFAAALAPKLERYAKADSDYAGCVGVDYGPDPVLGDAAKEAGISRNRFPWKTNMWIRSDLVTVSAGYGAGTALVWASDEWLATRPLCDSQKYDTEKYRTDRDYHGEPWSCSLPVHHSERCAYDRPLALCGKCGQPEKYWHAADDGYGKPRADHKFTAVNR